MPKPRQPRPPREPPMTPDERREWGRLWAELRARLNLTRWHLECRNEHWRRVRAKSPPNGPWAAEPELAAEISRDRIRAGERPPPGLSDDWRP